MTDKELRDFLNPDGKFEDGYIQHIITEKRSSNIANGRPSDEGLNNIDLNIEFASVTGLRKFTKEYMERKIQAQAEKSEINPDDQQNLDKKIKTLDKKLQEYYKYYNAIIKDLKK
jgi:hypothetical protein